VANKSRNHNCRGGLRAVPAPVTTEKRDVSLIKIRYLLNFFGPAIGIGEALQLARDGKERGRGEKNLRCWL